MQRLRVRAALLGLSLAFPLAGCAGRGPEPDAPPSIHVLEVDNAFLWRVTGDDPDADPLHLLGSIHALDVPLDVGPRIAALFRDAPEILIEVDSREIDPMHFLQTAAQLGRLAPLESLDDYIDEPARERLDRFLADHPAPAILVWDLDHTAPWLLWFWVSLVALEEWGVETGHGVESYFLERAGGKAVASLESMTEQFEAMAAVPLAEQGDALARGLSEWETSDGNPVEELDRLLAAWKRGDAEGLRDALQTTPGFEREILVRRNERMATRLADRVRGGGPRLAIVGAAHLVGDRSIVEGLRRRGYRVERVR